MLKQTIKRWRDTSPLMEPVCRVLRKVVPLPQSVWQHLAFTGIADFTVAGRRVKMRHFGAEIENSLFWAGYGHDWEATTLLAWVRLAGEAQVVFDVGANTGLFALAACAANPAARVHAFEPMPAIAARLRQNVALNASPVTVHQLAVSDSDGSAQIRAMEAAHEYSASFEQMDWMNAENVTLVEVKVARLDGVIAATGDRPDLIKLDVERHEPQALRGLWAGLGEGPPPTMVIEVLDDEVAARVRDEIEGRGYSAFVIHEGQSITRGTIHAEPGTMNWLLIPEGATGFGAQLIAQGTMSHAELIAGRS